MHSIRWCVMVLVQMVSLPRKVTLYLHTVWLYSFKIISEKKTNQHFFIFYSNLVCNSNLMFEWYWLYTIWLKFKEILTMKMCFLLIFLFLLWWFPEEEWKAHRKLIGPTINQHTLNKHLPIFNRHIRETVSDLPTDGKFFDILKYISKCKLAMFVEASLGAELDPELRQRFQDHLPE